MQCLNHFPQIHRVDVGLQHAVDDDHLRRRGVLTESVGCSQYIDCFEWRTHSCQSVRHVIA
jgi:hypothetical protein